MKSLYTFLFLSIISLSAHAQKVGLVFSGGGAKGLAHVGVLKALEENEIPVNYIVGTSMGGIVGGCYAAGMSPEQIEQLVLSPEFLRLINGTPEPGFNSFYHRSDDSPQFIKLNLELDSTLNFQFNTNIARDVSLNFGLAEKMAQAAAISNNNFDSLFIPFRVVTSDIFTQHEVVLSKGQLSDALRATQSVPYFYGPIRVDGRYLFDGGVYNNFPVDILQKEFNPDIIIGSNVSSKIYNEYPYGKDEKLISRSLIFMLLDKSDPTRIPSTGVYIQPNLSGLGVYDFAKVKAMVDSGYAQTIRQMPEIKQKIAVRKTCDDVAVERNNFNNKSYPFLFDGLSFKHFTANNRGYLRRMFKTKRNPGTLFYSQIKEGYFKLVSEEYFSNTYPNILFNKNTKRFTLQLSKRPQQNFQVDFGGVMATRDVSNLYLGLNFFRFNRTLTHAYLGFQTGNFYKMAVAKVRVDFPHQFYLEPYVSYDSKNYLQNDDVLNQVSSSTQPTVLKRIIRRYALHLGFPAGNFFKSVLGFEVFNTFDRYINGDVFISTDVLDKLKLKGFKTGFLFSANTLNRKQYASHGRAFAVGADYFHLREIFTPGTTSIATEPVEASHQWFRARATAEHYFGSGVYKPGYYVEAVFSNQPVFQNYFGTIINAPAFSPMQDSPTLILQNFRSFNYIAGGMRNVFTILPKFDIRIEGYVFKPFDYIQQVNQEASVSRDFKTVFFAGATTLVFHSVVGPVALSANYYDDSENQFGVLLHIGFLLFNKHSLE